jgi:hypothetical protein
METLRKLRRNGKLDDIHICPQGKLENSKFSRRRSYVEHLLE